MTEPDEVWDEPGDPPQPGGRALLDAIPLDVNGCRIETGRRYRVEIADCCVTGHFLAELVNITVGNKEADTIGSLRFANGVTFDALVNRALSFVPVLEQS